MIFAKIDFINLLPFYIFIKKNIKSSQTKQIINYKKSYPSDINKKFKKKVIDGAFISSIVAKKCKCLDIGIVAKKDVLSVLVKRGENKDDFQSNTSNMLAKVLNIQGEIIIGDKALYKYHNSTEEFTDLAKLWNDKYNLPFVFALLCVNKEYKTIKNISSRFLNANVKIPQYILNQYSKKTGITNKQIKQYLKKISYDVGYKEKRSLRLFFKLSKQFKTN